MRQGDPERAVALGRRALALSAGDTHDAAAQRARIISAITGIEGTMGTLPNPESVGEWVELARRVDDPYEESQALAMLSVTRFFRGEEGAIDAGEQAVHQARHSGSPTALSYARFVLGQAIGVSNPQRALGLLDESIAAAESVQNEYGIWVAGQVRGSLLSAIGDHVAAMRSSLDSAARSERGGDRSHQAICLWNVAAEFTIGGNPEPAATVLGWTRSVLGDFRGFGATQATLAAALATLPTLLPAERLAELMERGAAMDHDEILRFAQSEVEALLSGD
jgi:hypothetical protein